MSPRPHDETARRVADSPSIGDAAGEILGGAGEAIGSALDLIGGQPPPPPFRGNGSSDGAGDAKFERSRWEKRKPRSFWMRIRLLVLIAAIWGVLFWYSLTDPLVSVRDGLVMTWNSKWWLTVLFALELVRQVHYLVSEHWGWWNHLWTDVIFGGVSRRTGRMNDWAKYRAKRVVTVLIIIALIAVIAGAAEHTSPVQGLFSLPGKLVGALGVIAYALFFMVIAVGQFVAIFWFLSRGGIETYFPDDIKTRFNHVWGQDAVLERVKENLVFLEDPEAIESRGGFVPGGILLWGPPGTGKTLMAEAVAGETGKPFVFVEPAAFINMFLGIGPLKVKSLFRKLRKLATRYGGVIAFFDEADSLGNRGALAGGGVFGPGGVGGMSAPSVWSEGSCHGGAYLSEPAVSALVSSWRDARAEASLGPEPKRGVRNRMFVGAGMGGGSGGMGTLEALLAEMSGLQKPRGFMNRVVRRVLGMKPKPPPKYRILIMMATNMPNSLDQALLRPGRIDRIYRVGYPSKAGRIRTYQGYFAKVRHELTDADIDKLATITPYATGATIKDLVNESLIVSLRHKHDAITWADVLEAKRLKDLGPPEDVEYIERERHAVAVHEACHALVAYRVRKHLEIDLATIEKGQSYLGMVSSVKPEDRFTSWRSEFEADVMVALASLAGERLFFGGDSSSGVSGDLESATTIAGLMEGYWGMGSSIASKAARRQASPWPGQGGDDLLQGEAGKKVEERLHELLDRTRELLEHNRPQVFAIAHALESHKTLSGEDVEAVVEAKLSRGIDGRVYGVPRFLDVYGAYHDTIVEAHRNRLKVSVKLPEPAEWAPELVEAAAFAGTNGDGHSRWPVPAGDLAGVGGPSGSANGGWGGPGAAPSHGAGAGGSSSGSGGSNGGWGT
jgi:cell division protease FtsH